MKKSKEVKITTNPRIQRLIERTYTISCSYCAPNKGCNRKRKKDEGNWKSFRVNQWKE